MAKSIKRNLIKVLLAVLVVATVTFVPAKYVPINSLKMKEANALAPFKMLLAAAGVSTGDETSYVFDGTGDDIQIADSSDFTPGSSNYTIEGRFYITDVDAQPDYYICGQRADAENRWSLRISSGGSFTFRYEDGNVVRVAATSNGNAIVDATWMGFSVVKTGNTYTMYTNGVSDLASGGTGTGDLNDISADFFVGTNGDGIKWNGNIDEFRISNTNRYTGNYTVATSEFEDDANTLFLFHGAEDVVSGSKGTDGWTALDVTGDHTMTGNGDVDEDAIIFAL